MPAHQIMILTLCIGTTVRWRLAVNTRTLKAPSFHALLEKKERKAKEQRSFTNKEDFDFTTHSKKQLSREGC